MTARCGATNRIVVCNYVNGSECFRFSRGGEDPLFDPVRDLESGGYIAGQIGPLPPNGQQAASASDAFSTQGQNLGDQVMLLT